MIDLSDFEAEHAEALAQANEYARRAEKGLPEDRWATTRQQHLVAKGIRAMQQIMHMQAEVLEAIVNGRK